MFQRFHDKRENEKGFTLIELLVVILIIAILAAIAIPVFLSQRQKGWQSQLESALKNASTAIESFSTSNNGSYTGALEADLADEGYRAADAVGALTITTNAAGDEYCIAASHGDLDDPASMAVSSQDSQPTENTCAAGVKAP